MRTLLSLIAVMIAQPLLAADPKPADPPPPPPLPTATVDEATVQPEVTIIQKEDATYSEYRLRGKLYMIRVQPKVGPEYYLHDDDGTGQMVRRDGQGVLRPPMWVIKRF